MVMALIALGLLCLLALTVRFPRCFLIAWILVLETGPDQWADRLTGAPEALTGALKTYGLVLVVVLAWRHGPRRDRYNPAFAFAAMFFAGLAHGLYPGLSLLASLRSLAGSAMPFLFGFLRLPRDVCAAIVVAVLLGPFFALLVAAGLAALGMDQLYSLEQGALRLGGADQPPFLAGFALIGLYAGLVEFSRRPHFCLLLAIAADLLLILLTGARAPLLLGFVLLILFLLFERRLALLAGLIAAACLALIFADALGFLRVVDLTRLGEATDLSNRTLVWPYFSAAFWSSPWLGWGVGAGKFIVPLDLPLAQLLGTNAAHDEYLRLAAEGGAIGLLLLLLCLVLWVRRRTAPLPPAPRRLMRLIFCAFALHSATDNTLIATTGTVFFVWAAAIFATGAEETKAAP